MAVASKQLDAVGRHGCMGGGGVGVVGGGKGGEDCCGEGSMYMVKWGIFFYGRALTALFALPLLVLWRRRRGTNQLTGGPR